MMHWRKGCRGGVCPLVWYNRYGRRIEESRLPKGTAEREAYAHTVGEDGFLFLDALDTADAPEGLRALPSIDALRRTWQRHYDRPGDEALAPGEGAQRRVRFKTNRELPPATEGIESPYDTEARYRHKRDTQWTGYMVHVSETCEPTAPHLLTHVHTTPATVHEAQCTDPIQQALVDKDMPPDEHLVDAAYIAAKLFVSESRDAQGITLRGPANRIPTGKRKLRGVYLGQLCRGLGAPAGALSTRQNGDELGRADGCHRHHVHPGAPSSAGLPGLCSAHGLHPGAHSATRLDAASAGTISGPPSSAGVVCQ